MKHKDSMRGRILSIDPTSRGFGFVVFEYPDRLIDWGIKDVGRSDNDWCLGQIEKLIDVNRPVALVLEDCLATGCRRRKRARRLIARISDLGFRSGVRVRLISRQKVMKRFSNGESVSKVDVQRAIIDRYPELKPWVPPERKPWMSEDSRSSIFDAAGFALSSP